MILWVHKTFSFLMDYSTYTLLFIFYLIETTMLHCQKVSISLLLLRPITVRLLNLCRHFSHLWHTKFSIPTEHHSTTSIPIKCMWYGSNVMPLLLNPHLCVSKPKNILTLLRRIAFFIKCAIPSFHSSMLQNERRKNKFRIKCSCVATLCLKICNAACNNSYMLGCSVMWNMQSKFSDFIVR